MVKMKSFARTVILTCMLLYMVACGTPQPAPTLPPTSTPMPIATPEPTATPVPPTETPVPEVQEWEYLAIAPYIGYPDSPEARYAAYIEMDLGVKVDLTTKTRFLADSDCAINDEIIDGLRNDEKLRKLVGEADVVTIETSYCDIYYLVVNEYMIDRCGGEDNMDCVADALLSYRASCDAIYEEILSLSQPGTIVRTMTLPHGHLKPLVDSDLDLAPFYVLYNEQIVESAAEHNIPLARVDIAFHGESGDEDAVAKGLMPDNFFALSAEGMGVVADLWRDLGYEPLSR